MTTKRKVINKKLKEGTILKVGNYIGRFVKTEEEARRLSVRLGKKRIKRIKSGKRIVGYIV